MRTILSHVLRTKSSRQILILSPIRRTTVNFLLVSTDSTDKKEERCLSLEARTRFSPVSATDNISEIGERAGGGGEPGRSSFAR